MGDAANAQQEQTRATDFLLRNEEALDKIRQSIADLDKRIALLEAFQVALLDVQKQARIALFTAIGAILVDIILRVIHFGGLF